MSIWDNWPIALSPYLVVIALVSAGLLACSSAITRRGAPRR